MSSEGEPDVSDAKLLSQEFERRERKREQNRIAQRNYRLNQKRRLRALETAVKRSAHVPDSSTPPGFDDSQVERCVTSIHDRSNSMLHVNTSDAPNSASISNISGEAFPQSELWSAVPSDPCNLPVEVLELPEFGGPSSNRTPLQIAIQNKNVSLVQILLREGADVARQDQDGSTALHLAVESGQKEIVDAILKRTTNPNEPDYSGRMALFRAIESENREVTKLLLNYASDPNPKDMWGKTALHLAVEANSEDLALLLLEYGAHIDP